MDRSLAGVRILHVHTLPIVSGSGINTFLTMKGSQEAGAEVSLACAPGGRLQDKVTASGMTFFPIRNFVSEVAPFKDLHALLQLRSLLKREKFDIVHTHNSKGGIIGRFAARQANVPIVVHTVHGWSFHESESRLFRPLFILLERRATRWCDRMIAISQPLIDWAKEANIAPPSAFLKIFSGIDVAAFANRAVDPVLRSRLGIQQGETVIGHVSKLWEGKGHDVLLQALRMLLDAGHRVRVLIVGEGPLEDRLRSRVEELSLENQVVFTGFVEDVPAVTALIDIGVLPSFFEGMGRVVLEAMAAGKPVVASAVGGIPELVSDGITGFLVPPGDPRALADRIEVLLKDPELRARMGTQGRLKLDQEHSADTMVSKIHNLYFEELVRVS